MHRYPENGIPYAPAWDDGGDEHCVAWSAYLPQADGLWVRSGRRDILVREAEAVGGPCVLGMGAARFLVAAPVMERGVWRCELYEAEGGRVEPCGHVDVGGAHVSMVRAAATRQGAPVLAFGLLRGRQATVCVQKRRGSAWKTIHESPAGLDADRPAVTLSGEHVAVAYDAWDGRAYHVYVEFRGTRLQVSQGPGWHTSPDIVVDEAGRLWIAWVHQEDVISAEGAIDQRYTLQIASLPGDEPGCAVEKPIPADDLSHGLLDTSPGPQGVWGYHGRRIHPMLLCTPEGVHLLWEQKDRHETGTRVNTGVLWSRRLSPGVLSEPRAVLAGGLWYETPGSKRGRSNCIEVAGFTGVDGLERRVNLFTCRAEPADARRLPPTAWSGWRPVRLPLPGAAAPAARPAANVGGEELHLYWLDPHAHSVWSGDAEGETDVCYRYGRYKAMVDGVLLSENDYLYGVALSHAAWRACCASADAHDRPGAFVALNGYEWTCVRTPGPDHRTVLLPAAAADIARWNERNADPQALCRYVEEQQGILHAHHPAWELTGKAVDANVEVASGWDTYIESSTDCIHAALAQGHRVGFIGGSDSHRRNPGLGGALTGVWARSLDREAILEALRRHRCFATDGCRAVIDFRANGHFMGETVTAQTVRFTAAVTAPTPIASVEIWTPHGCIRRWAVDGATAMQASHDTHSAHEHAAYYVRVVLAGAPHPRVKLPANLQPAVGHYAWSSPIFCTPPERGEHP